MKPMIKLGLSALAVAIASTALVGCDDDSSSSGGGSHVINTSGGNGSLGGDGGDAEYIEVEKYTGWGLSAIKGSGSVNADFSKKSLKANLGSLPLTVSADTTITEQADCSTEPAAGTVYAVQGYQHLYISDGAAGACEEDEEVTGIHVAKGVTLTLPLNNGGNDFAYVVTNNDIHNEGTITSLDVSASLRGGVDLQPSNYIGGKDSAVLTNGTQAGQEGGDIYIETASAMVNDGDMNTSGADATAAAGGDAGYIYLDGEYYAQNTGTLTANGGSSTGAFDGGSADYVQVYAGYGSAFNSGALTANGGNGANGGDAGDIYVNGAGDDGVGDAFNKGAISAIGGSANGGNGGDGGYVEVTAYGGEVRNNADIVTYGGSVTTSTTGSGGDGGDVYFQTYAGELYESTAPGDILVTGNIDTHGGSAVASGTGSGGEGGYVYAYSEDDDNIANIGDANDVLLVGYKSATANGGSGNHGGEGDDVLVYNWEAEFGCGGWDCVPTPSGKVELDLDFTANGGDAVAGGNAANGEGGDAGGVGVETDYWQDRIPDTDATAKVNGKFVLNGGANRSSTDNEDGEGGWVWVWGYDGVTATVTVTATGGSDSVTNGGTDGYGGDADYVEFWAELGKTKVSGDLTLGGGNGEYDGGYGGYVGVWGPEVSQSGDIDVSGGDAVATLAGSVGGEGGWIDVVGLDGKGSATAIGNVNYAGGTGTTAGDEGAYQKLLVCYGNCN